MLSKECELRVRAMIGEPLKADGIIKIIRQDEEKQLSEWKAKQKDGIRKRKNHGRQGKKKPRNYPAILSLYCDKRITTVMAANALGISRSTFYRWYKEDTKSKNCT